MAFNKFYYSIDKGKTNRKYGELKGFDTIHTKNYESYNINDTGKIKYMTKLSYDIIIISQLAFYFIFHSSEKI